MSQRKRRSFLHWLFFQNTDKKRPTRPVRALLPDYSGESQPDEMPRQPGFTADIVTTHDAHQSHAKSSASSDQANKKRKAPKTASTEAAPPPAAPPTNKWIKLAIRSEQIQTVVELDTFPVEIGSVKSSFKLNDKGISPRHAVMDLHSDMLSIVDTHSQNGVSIGDNLIEPGVAYPLFPGDTVIVGRTEITIIDYSRNGDEAPPTSDEPPEQTSHARLQSAPESDIPVFADIPNEMETPGIFVDPDAFEPLEDIPAEMPQPLAEPEPAGTTSTIMKLLDEPNIALFRDVLELGELPQPDSAADTEPERELTSDDIDQTLQEPEPEPIKKPEPPKSEETPEPIKDEVPPTPVLALTAEEFIDALVDESSHAELLPELTLAEQLASMDIETPPPPTPQEPEPSEEASEAPLNCSQCGTANQANDKFCGKCGTSLKAAPPPPPEVKAFCGQCGAKNEHMTKFCGDCGYKLG